jgi:hypothetical protein
MICCLMIITRDPRLYPDFDDFRPERFLGDPQLQDLKDTKGMGHVTFGFGKRFVALSRVLDSTLIPSRTAFVLVITLPLKF